MNYAERVVARDEARADMRRYQAILDDLGPTDWLYVCVSQTYGSYPTRILPIREPEIVEVLKTLLKLKCGALSRIVNTEVEYD